MFQLWQNTPGMDFAMVASSECTVAWSRFTRLCDHSYSLVLKLYFMLDRISVPIKK